MVKGGIDDNPSTPPSIPNDGPISNPLTPPDAPPLVPPKLDPPGIPPFIPPAVGSKGLEDYINWAKGKNNGQKKEKYIPNTGIWTQTGNKKSEWLKENNYRTQWRDREKDQLRNKDGKPVSLDLLDENGNIIGRIDKNYRVNGKVVPEHAHLDSDINNVHRWFND